MMKGKLVRLIVLLFSLSFALATTGYTFQAAAMTLEMNQSDNTHADGCCPDADDDASICMQMCLNAGMFALTAEQATPPSNQLECRVPLRRRTLSGHVATPDPGPPKSVSLL